MSENLDLVRSICTPWAHGDYGRADWAHPEIELVVVGGPAPGYWHGLAAMAQGSRAFLSPWQDLRINVGHCVSLSSAHVIAATHLTVRGGMSGSLSQGGMSPAVLFKVKDDKIIRLVVYWDGDRALGHVGLTA